MITGLLGIASGTGLYLWANVAGAGHPTGRIAVYIASVVLLAASFTWALGALRRVSKAYMRTATYLLKCKLAAREEAGSL
jgi:hypothetical protein